MKRHKSQKFGLNPEWAKKYILKPLSIIIAVAAIMIIALNKYNSYASEKAERESIEAIARAERDAEEKAKQESIREKAEQQAEKQRQEESIAQAEIEKRKSNTLYEDMITKKVIEGKKYWRNNKLNKVGKVESIYGLDVITNNNWQFTLDTNGNIPSEVVNIGYPEYIKALKKQKESEEKKHQIENAYKTNELYEHVRSEQKKKVIEYFGGDIKHKHFIFEGKKYKIKEVDGRELRLIEKNTRKTILIDAYDPRLKKISVDEYYKAN